VVPILKGELRVINIDLHNQRKECHIPVPTPQGETIWVHPDIIESYQWMNAQSGSPKAKLRHPPAM